MLSVVMNPYIPTVVEYYPAKTSCELAANNIPLLSGHATVTSAGDETTLPE